MADINRNGKAYDSADVRVQTPAEPYFGSGTYKLVNGQDYTFSIYDCSNARNSPFGTCFGWTIENKAFYYHS